MGAAEFSEEGFGRDVDEAFVGARDRAQWEHGHAGYSGTIAEKGEVIELDRKAFGRLKARRVADLFSEAEAAGKGPAVRELYKRLGALAAPAMGAYTDKWGPALAIGLTPAEESAYRKRNGLRGRRGHAYLFFGWASS